VRNSTLVRNERVELFIIVNKDHRPIDQTSGIRVDG